MIAVILIALAIISPSTAPTTKPTTRPTIEQVKAEKVFAEKALSEARKSAEGRAKEDPEFKKLSQAERSAQDKMIAARAGGTIQEKLDALADYSRRKKDAEAFIAEFVAKDSGVIAANAKVRSAESDIIASLDAEQAERERQKQIDAVKEAERLKDPIYKAMKEHRIVVGMTLDQAKEAAGASRSYLISESDGAQEYKIPDQSHYERKYGNSYVYIVIVRDGKITEWVEKQD